MSEMQPNVRTCPVCNGEVEGAPQKRYCSAVCGDRASREKNRENRSERKRAYHAANREAIKARQRAYYAANREAIKARQRAWRETNKKKIREINRAYYAANPDKVRQRVDRRKARQKGARVERVYRRRVFERDGWRCGICGGKTLKKAKHPHPKAPVLDHIIPLSKGGEHSMRNVQCAHHRCNAAKRDGACGSQLLLVG
jgi:5-methylcytosine-specific restriction endonuclease McrA